MTDQNALGDFIVEAVALPKRGKEGVVVVEAVVASFSTIHISIILIINAFQNAILKLRYEGIF